MPNPPKTFFSFLKVIDRRNSVFKLSQGVFIAPTPLEQLYGTSDLVKNVFVYGKASMHSIAVAVVPSSLLKEQGTAAEAVLLKVCDYHPNYRLITFFLLQEFRAIGRKAGRPAWEIPHIIVIDDQVSD